MATKVTVFDAKGAKKGDVSLPAVFSTPLRPDLIQKAVQAARANRRQRYGASPMAGAMHSTKSAGKGKGMSRVPRIQGSGPGALAPPTVGGRRAHPPRARRDFTEKINDKERQLAIRSAIAATSKADIVVARGHRIDAAKLMLPVVVDDKIEDLVKTQQMADYLAKIGLGADLDRAKDGVHERAGRGKLRGRRIRTPVSLLLVSTNPVKARRGAGNLEGVQVTSPRALSAELLAPGGTPGRLTVFTESALKQLEEL